MTALNLTQSPSIKDFQVYVDALEKERGFDKQTPAQQSMLLGEEIGELFKAMRKHDNQLRVDENSRIHNIADELADVFIYVCSIANRYNVDLEAAFREKEEKNKARTWK